MVTPRDYEVDIRTILFIGLNLQGVILFLIRRRSMDADARPVAWAVPRACLPAAVRIWAFVASATKGWEVIGMVVSLLLLELAFVPAAAFAQKNVTVTGKIDGKTVMGPSF